MFHTRLEWNWNIFHLHLDYYNWLGGNSSLFGTAEIFHQKSRRFVLVLRILSTDSAAALIDHSSHRTYVQDRSRYDIELHHRMRRTLLLLAACIVASKCIENIDLQEPIVRTAPDGLNEDGYFGYSIVLHQKQVSSGFTQNLQNT